MSGTWDDDRVTRLRELWGEGFTASQIAAKLSDEFVYPFTRNMVISKQHRMGLSRDPQYNSDNRRRGYKNYQKRTMAPAKPQVAAKVARSGMFVSGGGLPVDPLPVEDTPPAELVKFEDLTSTSCRWIYGDPRQSDSGFCGKHVVPGQSWCSVHCQRVFAVPVVKHREPAPVRVPTFADLEKV